MSIIDKVVRDKDGRVVLWQRPNLPILVWAGARALQWPLSGRAEQFVGLVGTGALLVWAVLELFSGVNYFRRALGLLVLVVLLAAVLR